MRTIQVQGICDEVTDIILGEWMGRTYQQYKASVKTWTNVCAERERVILEHDGLNIGTLPLVTKFMCGLLNFNLP